MSVRLRLRAVLMMSHRFWDDLVSSWLSAVTLLLADLGTTLSFVLSLKCLSWERPPTGAGSESQVGRISSRTPSTWRSMAWQPYLCFKPCNLFNYRHCLWRGQTLLWHFTLLQQNDSVLKGTKGNFQKYSLAFVWGVILNPLVHFHLRLNICN